MAKGYVDDIEKLTRANTYFRQVLYTSKHSQLVLMSLKPLEEIGAEVHTDNDQFFRIEEGEAEIAIDGNVYEASDGYAVVVPAGSEHNVKNTSDTKDLKIYTVYSPAHHRDKVVHKTKEEAMNDDESFQGVTTE